MKSLITFIAVADHLSFHIAAERLHYAQSTVSAQIIALEEDLGVRLFDRLGRRILLTQAGETLYEYARRILDLRDAARADLQGRAETAGSLTVRVPDSLCVHRMPAVTARFRERMPRVKVRFVACAQEGLTRDLAKGVIDLAFLLTDSVHSLDLNTELLGVEELVLLAAPDHPLARAGPVTTDHLRQWPFLASNVDCSYRRQMESALHEGSAPAFIPVVFNSAAAVISHVRRGLGWTILPRMAAAEGLADGALAPVDWEEGPLETACLMIWRRDRWLSPALLEFMAAIRSDLYPTGS